MLDYGFRLIGPECKTAPPQQTEKGEMGGPGLGRDFSPRIDAHSGLLKESFGEKEPQDRDSKIPFFSLFTDIPILVFELSVARKEKRAPLPQH